MKSFLTQIYNVSFSNRGLLCAVYFISYMLYSFLLNYILELLCLLSETIAFICQLHARPLLPFIKLYFPTENVESGSTAGAKNINYNFTKKLTQISIRSFD